MEPISLTTLAENTGLLDSGEGVAIKPSSSGVPARLRDCVSVTAYAFAEEVYDYSEAITFVLHYTKNAEADSLESRRDPYELTADEFLSTFGSSVMFRVVQNQINYREVSEITLASYLSVPEWGWRIADVGRYNPNLYVGSLLISTASGYTANEVQGGFRDFTETTVDNIRWSTNLELPKSAIYGVLKGLSHDLVLDFLKQY